MSVKTGEDQMALSNNKRNHDPPSYWRMYEEIN